MRSITIIAFLITQSFLQAQTGRAQWEKVCDLPAIISESSGLVRTNKGTFWSHGDGGNAAELYEFDSTGNLLRTLKFSNATNIDWEDITRDDKGNLWLGDVGNNDSDRDNLVLYRVGNPDLHDSTRVHAGILKLTLEDQTVIPAPVGNRNFDIEGIASFKDSIILVTKNRASPSSGYAKIYWLPGITGQAVARLIDSIYTETYIQLGRITGADYYAAGQLLVLTSLHQVFVMPFKGTKIDPKTIKRYRFPFHNNQFESIVMRSPSEVYLTAEKPSILCRAVLSDSSFLYPLAAKELDQLHVYVYQNTVYFRDASFSGEIHLYDAAGRCVFRYFATEVQTVQLPLLAEAVYILRVQNAKGITVRTINN
jgi:hypothetical protein